LTAPARRIALLAAIGPALPGLLLLAPAGVRAVHDALAPGTRLVITDQALRAESGRTVRVSDAPTVQVDAGSDER